MASRSIIGSIQTMGLPGRLASIRPSRSFGGLTSTTLGFTKFVNYRIHVLLHGCSLGQVYATLGGGRDSHNRLHFTVLDNGVGLPHRVSILYKDRARSAEEALRDAVMGRLPRPVGGRGVGLDLVRRIASQYTEGLRGVGGASSIRIVTSGDIDGSASYLEWSPDSEDPKTSSVDGLPVRGTLVWVSLGLENRFADEGSHQLELTFAEPIAG